MSDKNPIDEFVESLPEDKRQQFRDAFRGAFHAMLVAEDIERERGKDPVGWAIKRLDFTGAPFPIYLEKNRFDDPYMVPVRLEWWPNGERGHYVEDRPEPVGVYEPISTRQLSMTIKRRWVEPERKVYGFTFRAALAFEHPDDAAAILADEIVKLHTGFRPRVKSQRETYEPPKDPAPAVEGGDGAGETRC